jgi:ankyrin repeat protein
VQLLLDRGADVQALNSSGMTALEIAIDREHHDIVPLLSQQAVEGVKVIENSILGLMCVTYCHLLGLLHINSDYSDSPDPIIIHLVK